MNLKIRNATSADVQLFYEWANDDLVRKQSFHSDKIHFEEHEKWFSGKLNNDNTIIYVFDLDEKPAGQVRLEIEADHTVVGISIDEEFRGKGLGVMMLKMAGVEYFKRNTLPIYAFIKPENISSIKSFEKAGYIYDGESEINSLKCNKYILEK